MKRRAVIYDDHANQDLHRIFLWIAKTSSIASAERIVSRIEDGISRFDVASERGSRHDKIEPGLRTAPVDERAVMAFKVYDDEVVILRIFYGGEDHIRHLKDDRATR